MTGPGYTPAELADLFAKVERDLAQADPGSTLEVVVRMARDMVPGAQMAGVSIGRDGRFSTRAATDDRVNQVDRIQYELGTGPCVDAIADDVTFTVSDLGADARWPVFGPRASAETGVLSMQSFRMFLEHDLGLVAALNLYSDQLGAFDADSRAVGMLFATHGALVVAGAAARDQADNLMHALKNSRDIGVAMGVLMQKYKVSRDEAFDLLRVTSQALHRKVADIAVAVGDTGELPEVAGPTRR
jgi:hypothetical protein